MAYPEESQMRENAAKPQITNYRESAIDRATRGDVSFVVDMRANTVFEQSLNRGYDRTTKPVGAQPAMPEEWDTVGGRASNDMIAARKLGTQGRD